jgi:hypothetical protein
MLNAFRRIVVSWLACMACPGVFAVATFFTIEYAGGSNVSTAFVSRELLLTSGVRTGDDADALCHVSERFRYEGVRPTDAVQDADCQCRLRPVVP